jgi:hypothetical protein
MKKLITVAACFVLFMAGSAQNNSTTIGIRGGYNFYTLYGQNASEDNFSHRLEDGYHLGMDIEFPIGTNVYLQPGLVYTQKGANFRDYEYHGQTYYGDVKLAYIEVPVNIVFKPSVGTGHLILGAGPYVGRATGREAGLKDGTYYDVRFTEDVSEAELEQTPFYYRPWDGGANLIAGYQFANNMLVQVNGQLGLKRINPTVNGQFEGKTAHRTMGFNFGVGYRF